MMSHQAQYNVNEQRMTLTHDPRRNFCRLSLILALPPPTYCLFQRFQIQIPIPTMPRLCPIVQARLSTSTRSTINQRFRLFHIPRIAFRRRCRCRGRCSRASPNFERDEFSLSFSLFAFLEKGGRVHYDSRDHTELCMFRCSFRITGIEDGFDPHRSGWHVAERLRQGTMRLAQFSELIMSRGARFAC